MARYSIKDLEKVTGIKAHTIRIWEKRYGIVEPDRSETNIRSYSDENLKKLLNISMLNRNGFKISRLANMSEAEISKELIKISDKPEDYNTKIEALLMAIMDFNEDCFDKVLKKAVKQMGFEDAFVKIVIPVLNKAGILWMSGTICPAQEHFVSNLIRQKIIAQIDSLSSKARENAKRFILFLPEGEMHELGLLFFSYLIRKQGHKFLYIGQSTPFKSLQKAVGVWKPDYIVTSIVNSMALNTVEDFLHKLEESFPDQNILINGYQTQQVDASKYIKLDVVQDYTIFSKMIKEL